MDWDQAFQLSRSQAGRDSLINQCETIAPAFRSALVHFFDSSPDFGPQQLTNRLLLLRNLCCGSNPLSTAIAESNILHDLFMLCRHVMLSKTFSGQSQGCENPSEMASFLLHNDNYAFLAAFPPESTSKVLRIVAQICANFTNCSETHKRNFVDKYICLPHKYRSRGALVDLVAACVFCQEQSGLQACWLTVQNVLLDAENCAFLCAQTTFQTLLKQLFLSLHSVKRDDASISEGAQVFLYHAQTQFPKATLLSLYCAVGPSASTSSTSLLPTLEQVLFLFVLDQVQAEEEVSCAERTQRDQMHRDQLLIHVAKQLSFVLRTCHLLAPPSSSTSKSSTTLDSFSSSVQRDFCVASLHLLCTSLAHLPAPPRSLPRPAPPRDTSSSAPSFASALSFELSVILLETVHEEVLQGRDAVSLGSFRPQRAASGSGDNSDDRHNTSSTNSEGDRELLWTQQMVRDALQLVGLLLAHDDETDAENEGEPATVSALLLAPPRQLLHCLLLHCATDFANPLSREFALLCIHRLVQSSSSARKYIDSLRPQQLQWQAEEPGGVHGGAEEEALIRETERRRGVTLQLDPVTGKLVWLPSVSSSDPASSSPSDANSAPVSCAANDSARANDSAGVVDRP